MGPERLLKVAGGKEARVHLRGAGGSLREAVWETESKGRCGEMRSEAAESAWVILLRGE